MTKEREAKQITPSVPFFCRNLLREEPRQVRTFQASRIWTLRGGSAQLQVTQLLPPVLL
jgi:hypothetical protein